MRLVLEPVSRIALSRLAQATCILGLMIRTTMPAGAADPKHVSDEHPTRPVTVSINGSALSRDETAVIQSGRVLVPMRSTLAALHLEVESRGDSYIVYVAGGRLLLNKNSDNAHLGARVVHFDTSVQNINGRVYVPLDLFRSVLGAVITFDNRNAHVTIVSALQVETPANVNAPPPMQGTVSHVDFFSNPPVLSLVADSRVHTIPLRSDVPVFVEDLIAGTRAKEDLSAVHVGDVASVQLTSDGSVSEIDDSFRSRSGRIAALSSRALALGNGHVITPSRDTTITLNGKSTSLDGLRVGDAVTIRSNPVSLEVREIIASREVDASASAANVKIVQCTFTPNHALRAHSELDVFLRGTPHGRASFDIGASVVGIPMTEISPGLYRGVYLVSQGANFRNAAVIGQLSVGEASAQPVTAPIAFSAATVPPQVIETAPRDGQLVNNTRPSIYASFETPTGIGIDPNSISLFVGGRDVTSQAVRTKHFVTYEPQGDLTDGATPVIVTVSDVAGNVSTYRWSFTEGP